MMSALAGLSKPIRKVTRRDAPLRPNALAQSTCKSPKVRAITPPIISAIPVTGNANKETAPSRAVSSEILPAIKSLVGRKLQAIKAGTCTNSGRMTPNM